MKFPPYSLTEASELCEEFRFLQGKEFGAEHPDSLVHNVVIAPFDDLARETFLLYLHIVDDASRILHEVYTGLTYDVLVIGKSTKDANDLVHRSLHKWNTTAKAIFDRSNISEAIKSAMGNSTPSALNLN